MAATTCTHLDQIQHVSPNTEGCEECLKIGQEWVSLRMCLTCGHVGCCDSSIGKHATAHFHETDHPIVQPVFPTQDWRWCYADRVMV